MVVLLDTIRLWCTPSSSQQINRYSVTRGGQNDDLLPLTQQVDDIAFVFKKRYGREVNAYYLRPLERSR